MMTILAMARVGPWLLLEIDDVSPDSATCERCGQTNLRWVWVMELQRPPGTVVRIGSDCGPNLEEVSREMWEAAAGPFEHRVKLLGRLGRCETLLAQDPEGHLAAADAGDSPERMLRDLVEAGTPPNRIRAIGSILSRLEAKLKRRERERVARLGPGRKL
jgi:hypothetical protein